MHLHRSHKFCIMGWLSSDPVILYQLFPSRVHSWRVAQDRKEALQSLNFGPSCCC